jgi:pyridoxamine 5'-phosphate oxidase
MLSQSLPDLLPAEPLALAAEWLAEAWQRREQPNPNAMVLATADAQGRPSARVVLCKDMEPVPGIVRFFTNYDSRKGQELSMNPRAAVVFHWDAQHRQVRIEGLIRKASAEDSDRYFASRPRVSQLGAHASQQSRPVESRAALRAQLNAVVEARGLSGIPRPDHWGGYVLWADAVELWVEGEARLHDRARWTRDLAPAPGEDPHQGKLRCSAWRATRLQP